MKDASYKGPLDAVIRLPALRGLVVTLIALFSGLFLFIAALEGSVEATGMAALGGVFLGTLVLIVLVAWWPIAAWQRVRGAWPDAEVVDAEVRVLNWDPFKQRRWTVLSPWNGAHHRARWLLLEGRLVWMGLQGVPWPDSRNALPSHPVELVPIGAQGVTGLPHAWVQPVFDRTSKERVPGRYRLSDPSNRSEMTLVIRMHEGEFAARFAGA
jgi:hypothetical protein